MLLLSGQISCFLVWFFYSLRRSYRDTNGRGVWYRAWKRRNFIFRISIVTSFKKRLTRIERNSIVRTCVTFVAPRPQFSYVCTFFYGVDTHISSHARVRRYATDFRMTSKRWKISRLNLHYLITDFPTRSSLSFPLYTPIYL